MVGLATKGSDNSVVDSERTCKTIKTELCRFCRLLSGRNLHYSGPTSRAD
jgi:hypothetical protein